MLYCFLLCFVCTHTLCLCPGPEMMIYMVYLKSTVPPVKQFPRWQHFVRAVTHSSFLLFSSKLGLGVSIPPSICGRVLEGSSFLAASPGVELDATESVSEVACTYLLANSNELRKCTSHKYFLQAMILYFICFIWFNFISIYRSRQIKKTFYLF